MAGELRQPETWWTYAVYTLVAVGCVVLAYYRFHAVVLRILVIAAKRRIIRLLAYPALFWLGLDSLLIVIRTLLWIAYRPAAAATWESAPRLTIIIPAYNEGAMVLQSIESVARAEYPMIGWRYSSSMTAARTTPGVTSRKLQGAIRGWLPRCAKIATAASARRSPSVSPARAAKSLFRVLYYLRSERSMNFLYGVVYAYYSSIALSWIFPYAVATVRSRKWMTR